MEKQTRAEPRFVDSPAAPEVFASEATGFFINQGNITVTFASTRADHSTSPGPLNRVVNLRVVLPASAAQSLALGLYDFLVSNGLDPNPRPAADETH
jgi:hypothetical protein